MRAPSERFSRSATAASRWAAWLPLKTHEILDALRAIERRSDARDRAPPARCHALRARQRRSPSYGVTSFDSTSPFRQAFKDDRDNYYTLDRDVSRRSACRRSTATPLEAADPRRPGRPDERDAARARVPRRARGVRRGTSRVSRTSSRRFARYERSHDPDRDRTEIYRETLERRRGRRATARSARTLGIHVVALPRSRAQQAPRLPQRLRLPPAPRPRTPSAAPST